MKASLKRWILREDSKRVRSWMGLGREVEGTAMEKALCRARSWQQGVRVRVR